MVGGHMASPAEAVEFGHRATDPSLLSYVGGGASFGVGRGTHYFT
jgi:hypothetical protein